MLLVLPLGVADGHGRPPRRAPVAHGLLVVALLLHLAGACLLLLPEGLAVPAEHLACLAARLRLQSDAGQGLFAPMQVWGQALVHDGTWPLVLGLIGWWSFAPALEQRLGSLRFLVWAAACLPLGGVLHLLALRPAPGGGLAAPALAAAGALLGLDPRARLHLFAGWWVLTSTGATRLTVGAFWGVAVLAGLDLLRGLLVIAGPPPGPAAGLDALALQAVSLLLAFVAGPAMARLLLGRTPPPAAGATP